MWLNYDDKYDVSDEGLVIRKTTGRILKPWIDPGGYGYIRLSDRKNRTVHSLVANLFCPKINIEGLEVDHINQDKTDNRAANLRWVDKSTNCRNRGNPTYIYPYGLRYQVQFKRHRKTIYYQSFSTNEEAEAARDAFKLTDAYTA